MTRSVRNLLLVLVVVALLVGIITPTQLGAWLGDAWRWVVDTGRAIIDSATT